MESCSQPPHGERGETRAPAAVAAPAAAAVGDPTTATTTCGNAEISINWTLLDPPRFGWTAAGGVADVLHPHEHARRKSTRRAYVTSRRSNNKKRDRREAFAPGNPAARSAPPGCRVVAQAPNGDLAAPRDDDSAAPTSTLSTSSTTTPHDNNNNNKDSDAHTDPAAETSATANAAAPPFFRAGDNVVDLYAYHRGRAGRELRDEVTGELLYGDVLASDTNHHSGDREPRFWNRTAPVTIKFALEDHFGENDNDNEYAVVEENGELARQPSGSVDDCTPGNNNNNNSNKRLRYFRDVVQWNLSDPATPNPFTFAAGVAQEFGLSYPQTMDLVESIQRQLANFIQEQCLYTPARVLRPQQEKPPPLAPCLYFDVHSIGLPGGTCHAAPKLKPAPVAVQRTGSLATTTTTATTNTTASTKASSNAVVKNGKNTVAAAAAAVVHQKRRRLAESNRKVEDSFYRQVRSRLRDASVREVQAKTATNNRVGAEQANDDENSSFESLQSNELAFVENHVCHFCQIEQALCGVFGCGDPSHAFCFNHLGELLGLVESTTTSPPQFQLDYCPICSLQCPCTDCHTKLDLTVVEFQKRGAAQSTTPNQTAFPELLDYCRCLDVEAEKKKAAAVAYAMKPRPRPRVPKPPRTEFPREVTNGVDLDYGFYRDYQTQFTEQGPLQVPTVDEPDINDDNNNNVASSTTTTRGRGLPDPAEDGSVDYCNECLKVGNLVCCDLCPRAFHMECLGSAQRPEIGATWQCPTCRREQEGREDATVTGSSQLQAICDAFPCPETTPESIRSLRLLSLLREMLLQLMDYDFGYMFKSRVDTKNIPGYTAIVEKPMDLGTIAGNMLNGCYQKELGDEFTLDQLAIAVLKDVELVWHNCFLFNVEGSAVYRMAQVQSRRAQTIRETSFDDLLSDEMKEELALYASVLQQKRHDRLDPSFSQSATAPATASSQGRHKIAGTTANKGRPVAVLDPDSGRIVKVYTSIPSATSALTFLLKLKRHRCEFKAKEVDSRDKLRKLLNDCRDDPNTLLFGYRWLYLEDLRNNSVVFGSVVDESSTPNPEQQPADNLKLLQVVDGKLSFFFNSVEEALCVPEFHDHNIPNLRKNLRNLEPETGCVELAGRQWTAVDTSGETVDGNPSQSMSLPAVDDVLRLPSVAYIKEDVVSGGRSLTGFPNVEAAFADWFRTIDTSIFPYQGRKTMEVFLSCYLDRDINVDGIRWRSVTTETDPPWTLATATSEKAKDVTENNGHKLARPRQDTTAGKAKKATENNGDKLASPRQDATTGKVKKVTKSRPRLDKYVTKIDRPRQGMEASGAQELDVMIPAAAVAAVAVLEETGSEGVNLAYRPNEGGNANEQMNAAAQGYLRDPPQEAMSESVLLEETAMEESVVGHADEEVALPIFADDANEESIARDASSSTEMIKTVPLEETAVDESVVGHDDDDDANEESTSLEASSSSKVLDLEVSPSRSAKPTVNATNGIISNIVGHFSPLIRWRNGSTDNE